MRAFGVIGSALIAGLALAPSQASTVGVFGPVDVVRSQGQPVQVSFPFQTPDPSAPHLLRIHNGGASGDSRKVASALIWLNGALIVGPNRFNGTVSLIEEPIAPEADNTLLVELRGKPGGRLTLEVTAVDDEPPEISVLFPEDGTIVSTPEVTVGVHVEDRLSGVGTVTCNGEEATATGGDYACTVPLAEGPNDVEIVATDLCGNSSSASLTVIFDPPPIVEITDPEDGQVLFSSPVAVSGTVDDPAASVTVNDVPAFGTDPFTASVPLPGGEQTLTAVARDEHGGEGTDSVMVTVLSPGLDPTVSIVSPADGFVVGGPATATFPPASVRVTGRVRVEGPFDNANKPDVTVNGMPAVVSNGGSPGPLCQTPLEICWWDFRVDSVSLPVGPATLTALAIDSQARSGSAEVSGFVELCIDGGFDGPALVGVGQNNRCHETDGCSTPDIVAPDVQDPTMGTLGHASTAFGKDTDVPPTPERFPHGASPRDHLPCNFHDVCYQTCGSVKTECDAGMYDAMVDVCHTAYPESVCPYTVQGPLGGEILDPIKCPQWRDEKTRCYSWASKYRAGLATPPAVGKFNQRQTDYCEPAVLGTAPARTRAGSEFIRQRGPRPPR